MTGSQNTTADAFLGIDPSLDAHAGLIATAAVLLAAVFALGLHTRRLLFAGLLAAALVLEIVFYVGMMALHSTPANKSAAAAAVLGSLLGPAAVCGALLVALPGIAAVGAGPEWGINIGSWRVGAGGVAGGLGCWLALAGLLEAIGTGVFVNDRNTSVIVGGLIVQLFVMVTYAALSSLLTIRAVKAPSEHVPVANYRLSQIRTWTAAINTATVIMLIHIIYRIIEQSQGPKGTLASSKSLALALVEIFPLITIAVSTVSPPSKRYTEATNGWPAYEDASRSATPSPTPSPSPMAMVKLPPYESVATPGLGVSHSRGGSIGSTAALDQRTMPVVVVDLRETAGRSDRKHPNQLVVDPDDLW